MKAIMFMYDTLCWRFLPPYGCDWVHAPNFERLARRAITFDRSYIGSFPTIPNRRELHTGRYNFLHRAWGPLEPFDDSMPAILKQNGIYTRLVTDTAHYFEDDTGNYHPSYDSHEFFRGQEFDAWQPDFRPSGDGLDPALAELYREDMEVMGSALIRRYGQTQANISAMQREEDFPQTHTFDSGVQFIRTYHGQDRWFLHIETFDPHQPFWVPEKYRALYPSDYHGPQLIWPPRETTRRSAEAQQHIRQQYAALVSMCDANLGRVLDLMDAYDLWKDTLLIVNTDHGFMFGEHGRWNKMWPWLYNEVARTPLFIWDPRYGKGGERRQALVQPIDLPPTLLDFFGLDIPADMQGRPLRETVAADRAVREAALFGWHGYHVHCTNGRYVYVRGSSAAQAEVYNYTVLPTRSGRYPLDAVRALELTKPFAFSKGCRTLKIKARIPSRGDEPSNLLFDLEKDPQQEHPIHDADVEQMMLAHMLRLMQENDAPPEQFARLGLTNLKHGFIIAP